MRRGADVPAYVVVVADAEGCQKDFLRLSGTWAFLKDVRWLSNGECK